MKKQLISELWNFLEREFESKNVRKLPFFEFFRLLWEKSPKIVRISTKIQLPSDRKLMKLLRELESEGRILIVSLNEEIMIELPEINTRNDNWFSKQVKLIRQHPHFENDNLQPTWHSWRESLGLPMGVPKSEILSKIEELLDSIPIEFPKERIFVESQITSLINSQSLGQKQPFRHQIHYDGKQISIRLGTFTREDVLDLLPDEKPISLQELYNRVGAVNRGDQHRLRASIYKLIDRNLVEKTSRRMYVRKKIHVLSPKKKEIMKKQGSSHQKKFVETLKILNKKGLIQKKQLMIGNHKEKKVKAYLFLDEGQIKMQGNFFSSLSAAAKAAGSNKSGWVFWHILNENGDHISMKDLRNRAQS